MTTAEPTTAEIEQHIANIKPIQITASAVAIDRHFCHPAFHKLYNYWWFSRFNHFRGIRYLQTQRSNDIFQQGLRLMAMIGFRYDCCLWFRECD